MRVKVSRFLSPPGAGLLFLAVAAPNCYRREAGAPALVPQLVEVLVAVTAGPGTGAAGVLGVTPGTAGTALALLTMLQTVAEAEAEEDPVTEAVAWECLGKAAAAAEGGPVAAERPRGAAAEEETAAF